MSELLAAGLIARRIMDDGDVPTEDVKRLAECFLMTRAWQGLTEANDPYRDENAMSPRSGGKENVIRPVYNESGEIVTFEWMSDKEVKEIRESNGGQIMAWMHQSYAQVPVKREKKKRVRRKSLKAEVK